jgi:glutamate synthase (NADPH/NADH) large chain
MLRKCHCNTCSVGIATQDPELREKFPGRPRYVVNYMTHIAREVRELMADLGFRTMDEMIGRADILEGKDLEHPTAKTVDLSELLSRPDSTDDPRKTREQNHRLDEKVDTELIDLAAPAIEDSDPVELERSITNRDRTFGTLLSARIAETYGEEGLPDDTVRITLHGSAGQSFGAFLSAGMTLVLDGDANDYCGKGLSGGKLVVQTPENAGYDAAENVLVGNVALYGATGGEAYFNGRAGERFAVRNSGVKTVVEGIGDHGCEYMTGGVAVVLGETGRNFGAGMSGGEAYVLDETSEFEANVNTGMVHLEAFDDQRDRELVKRMVENHFLYTGSERAEAILDDWETYAGQFVKVMPDAYAAVIEEHLDRNEDIRTSLPATPEWVAGAIPASDD